MPAALKLANSIAAADITDAAILRDLIGIDEEAAEHVVRAFRNLDSACCGQQIGIHAVLSATHNLREMCRHLRAKEIADDCAEAAAEQHADGQRHLLDMRSA
jgi:NAD(P)H-dependent FMN reductase